jgi:hypothetical protein
MPCVGRAHIDRLSVTATVIGSHCLAGCERSSLLVDDQSRVQHVEHGGEQPLAALLRASRMLLLAADLPQ